MTLHIQTDRTLIRAQAESTRYILARVSASLAPRRGERLPVNVAIVLESEKPIAVVTKIDVIEHLAKGI